MHVFIQYITEKKYAKRLKSLFYFPASHPTQWVICINQMHWNQEGSIPQKLAIPLASEFCPEALFPILCLKQAPFGTSCVP